MSSITIPESRISYHNLAPERGSFASFILKHARAWMSITLAVSDTLSLLACGLAAFCLYDWFSLGPIEPALYLRCIPVSLLFVAFYALRGLYPGIGLGGVEELRLLTINTSLIFVVITASSFWLHTEQVYSRIVFLLIWFFSLGCLPAGRILIRTLLARHGLWGEPVVIIGPYHHAHQVAEELRSRPKMGRCPSAIFDHSEPISRTFEVPVLPMAEMAEYVRSNGVHTALVIYNDLNSIPQVRDTYRDLFERVLLIGEPQHTSQLSGVFLQDFGGQLSLEIRQSLLDRWSQLQKRLIDVTISGLLLLLLAPFFALVTLLICLNSPGPAFYFQNRLGKGGKSFRMRKFRTMYTNADEVLRTVLERSPAFRDEWDRFQKLKNDPRITPIGRFLRRFSIDELPQIWNVFIGEMSLVGPRPIMLDQQGLYGTPLEHYVRVTPGMSGLWQIAGRNKTSFARRVDLDVYYVMNWSIWWDVYILARTVWVVITHDGAC